MKLRNIGIIISREYLTRVRKKSFLLTTFIVPVLFAAMCILPSVIMFMAKDKGHKVAVVDESGLVMPYLVDNEYIDYVDMSSEHPDSLKARFSDMEQDVILVVSELDSASRSVSVASYSEKPLSIDVKESISSKVNEAIEDYRLSLYNVDNLRAIMDEVKSDVELSTFTLNESGEEKITSSEVYMILSMLMSIIIYMFIAMFSGMVMQSVIEEKASRVVEVLVSSVKSTELMFGKIIGVACVALTQFFLWIVLTLILVSGFSAFAGFDAIAGDPAQTQELVSVAGQMGMPVDESVALSQDNSEMGVILSTLKQINYVQLIVAFVIYFALGYLLYASFFAAIGSAVENEADTNQLQMPVTVPLLLAFFIALYAYKSPDSSIVFWGSMIPFTSPIVMLARIPFGVPGWELAVSIAVLALTFVLCAWLSAKIYKIGILMFGKKTTFKDLWKWMKMK